MITLIVSHSGHGWSFKGVWATTETIILIVVIISSINLLLYAALHVQTEERLFVQGSH